MDRQSIVGTDELRTLGNRPQTNPRLRLGTLDISSILRNNESKKPPCHVPHKSQAWIEFNYDTGASDNSTCGVPLQKVEEFFVAERSGHPQLRSSQVSNRK